MKAIRFSLRLALLFFHSGALSIAAPAPHPLAPLSVSEIQTAVKILKTHGQLPPKTLIASLALAEPDKKALAMTTLSRLSREALAVIIDHGARSSREVKLDLTLERVLAVVAITNGQPLVSVSESTQAADTVRRDPKWQAAIRLRGIADFSAVSLITWAGGHHPNRGLNARRIARVLAYHQRGQINGFGPPIDGVEAIVDLDNQTVLQIIDSGVRPIPPDSTDFFDPKVRGPNRPALKPLLITQPRGPSFKMEEYQISWDRWRFFWSFNAREGLVLHQAHYFDRGQFRSILYRASISEMLVPYGSPSQTWFWRDAVDQGEFGLGHCASPLVPGQTVPAHATLIGAPVCGDTGEASLAPARVAIYERQNDGLWSHADPSSAGATIGRPSRELVLTFIAAIGNYDYRYSWTFRQDGVIEFETAMTGILLTGATEAEKCLSCEILNPPPGPQPLDGDERYGTLVAKNTIAVNHQHFVNVRLDFDIDGPANSVKEINARLLPKGPDNPHGNAWQAESTVFGTERESRRLPDWTTHRHWAVFNPNLRTRLGHFPSYLIESSSHAAPLMPQEDPSRSLLGFINHAFYATRYHPEQLFAGGKYPNQAAQPDNLETWTSDNESIRNEDVVLWHTLGITHIPRPEEFPVMPAARAGFRLVPKGFFERNPALDVP